VVVVVDFGAVVDVVVEDEFEVVEVLEDGAVVDVVVVDEDAPVVASRRAVTMVPFGLGSFVPTGTKPTVMSWSLLNKSVDGSPWTVDGCTFDEKASGQ